MRNGTQPLPCLFLKRKAGGRTQAGLDVQDVQYSACFLHYLGKNRVRNMGGEKQPSALCAIYLNKERKNCIKQCLVLERTERTFGMMLKY